jgi:hypothetical protein
MFACPQLFDLLHQFFLRMLDVDFVDAERSLQACDASIAWLLAVTLQEVEWPIRHQHCTLMMGQRTMTLSLGEMRTHLGPSLLAIKTRIPGH